MKNNLGKGMVFYTDEKNYNEVLENVRAVYPEATIEIVSQNIEIPSLSFEEQIMLGLISEQDSITISYTTDIRKNNNQTNEMNSNYLAALAA